MSMKIVENHSRKHVRSSLYNYDFCKTTGLFLRWGHHWEDDPDFSPHGPELLDLEISTGSCLGKCPFCYKCNGNGQYKNMTISTFSHIINIMPRTLTQIAFGITDFYGNPSFYQMMAIARDEYEVIPNYTCHGLDIDDRAAKLTADVCGAVAVSIVKKQKTYDAVARFKDAGCQQVNIHFMLAKETLDKAYGVIDDIVVDPRLKGLHAIIFLQYKPKGRGRDSYSVIPTVEDYRRLCVYAEASGVQYGFDSCSAGMYLATLDSSDRQRLEMFVEPCESGLFSIYINCSGDLFACSFAEGENEWKNGISVLNCRSQQDFLDNVWNNQRLVDWRSKLLSLNRECPIYDLMGDRNAMQTL